jgi:hypothetical protein
VWDPEFKPQYCKEREGERERKRERERGEREKKRNTGKDPRLWRRPSNSVGGNVN